MRGVLTCPFRGVVPFAVQGAGGGVGEVDVSGLWEADGALANHLAPFGLAESEWWAIDEKTDRFGERFGDRLRQESSMNQPARGDERRF